MYYSYFPITSGKLTLKEFQESIFGYDSLTKKWLLLNNSLKDLLLLCNGNNNIYDIIEILTKQYDSSIEEIDSKVTTSLKSLVRDSIIKFSNSTNSTPIRFRKDSSKWSLQSVFFELTNRCNLNCIHCYNNSSPIQIGELSKSYIFSIINIIDDFGVLQINYTGGEPFLRNDFPEIIRYTYEKGIDIGILTNGILINSDDISLLKKVNPKFIAVSLESLDNKKYKKIRGIDNKKVLKNILLMKENGINVRINTVLFNGVNNSYDDIHELLSYLKSNGFSEDDVVFDEFLNIGRGINSSNYTINAKETISIIREAFKDVYNLDFSVFSSYVDSKNPTQSSFCGIGESFFYLNSKGDITLCTVLNDSRFKIGNILTDSLDEIWNSSKLLTYFRNKQHIINSECEDCKYLVECAGGCKAKPMMLLGEFNKPDYWMCQIYNKGN